MLIFSTHLSTAEDTFAMDEWGMTILACIYNMSVNIPHLSKINTISFLIGCVYYSVVVTYTYGELPGILLCSLVATIFHYTSGLYSVYTQYREFHSVIFTNERLANEMKRLLEVFPESVFIWSTNPHTHQKSVWSNYQFEKNICEIQESIDELDRIFVRTKAELNENEESNERIVDTLNNLIEKHQQQANGEVFDEVIENIEVSFHWLFYGYIDQKDKVIKD